MESIRQSLKQLSLLVRFVLFAANAKSQNLFLSLSLRLPLLPSISSVSSGRWWKSTPLFSFSLLIHLLVELNQIIDDEGIW